ncbi:MAG: 4-hydroxythreonine-4-phosphate dehydrogenase PdxA [Rhodospirillaceae bacterium]|nr:4-hydroxythreonine-4-phosphate dehydrogenase PdxA [Rhodospirillaceae bacterium]
MTDIPPIAVTMGEPAGIGGELSLKTWLSRENTPTFFVIDDCKRLYDLAKSLSLEVPVKEIDNPEEAPNHFQNALPVIHQDLRSAVAPGQPKHDNTTSIITSITRAVSFAYNGSAAAIVTNPVSKSVLYEAKFKYPGQTEFLASLVKGEKQPVPVMMLSCEYLRVVPITIHIPLSEVPGTLTSDCIIKKCEITESGLRKDFGIKSPKLIVAGLNPHAGENQELGIEEEIIIRPAIEVLKNSGIQVTGPYPADTLFHKDIRDKYDVAICMYHDQALIPLKTLDFMGGINITLGLPFIRTSPDHGTAFDIAGKGIANPSSLIASIKEAAYMARNRAY